MRSTHSKEYQAALDVLVAARKHARLTQQRLADRLGRPQSYVSKYENGERRIDIIELLLIVRAIGASPSAILDGILQRCPALAGRPKRRSERASE